jgi:hypothetical protein
MNSNKFAEKRVYPRVSLEIPLKCRLMEGALHADSISEMRKRTIKSTSSDVSLGGMYIRAEQPLSVGTIMALDFSLPKKPAGLSAFAEVIWTNEEGAGIHFLALKEEDLESLKETLSNVPSGR